MAEESKKARSTGKSGSGKAKSEGDPSASSKSPAPRKASSGAKKSASAKSGPESKPGGSKTASGGEAGSKAKPPISDKRRRVLQVRLTILAIALFGLGIGFFLMGGDDDDGGDESGGEEAVAARVVSAEELSSLAASSVRPIYWAGERSDTQLELNEEEDGSVYLRYIGLDSEPGDPGPFLTIGSYPIEDPEAALDEAAARPDAIVRSASDGRRVVSSTENPNSVYFVSPDNSVQVEVYDPDAKAAMDLALSGEVQLAD